MSNVSVRELFSRESNGLKAMVPAGDGADLEISLKLLLAGKELSMVLDLIKAKLTFLSPPSRVLTWLCHRQPHQAAPPFKACLNSDNVLALLEIFSL